MTEIRKIRIKSKSWLLVLSLFVGLASASSCSRSEGLDEPLPATRDKTFLVTPRWSPDGQSLLASARGGVGLHLLDLGSATRVEIHSTFRGEAHFARDGSSLAFQGKDQGFYLFDLRSRRLAPVKERPAFLPPQGAASLPAEGRLLYDAEELRVFFEPYRGGVSVQDASGIRVLEESGAWGVRVGRGGRVAWCLGHLAVARLRVFDPGRGLVELEQGAQPTWSPDEEILVFARPEAGPSDGEVLCSELYAHNLQSGRTLQLTRTPGVIEMEPAFSPAGDRLAFADWGSGQVLVSGWSGLRD